MTKRDKDRLIKALRKDCTLQNTYIAGEATCAVACIALQAGVSKRALRDIEGVSIDAITSDRVSKIVDKIRSKFGLGSGALGRIQCVNDSVRFTDDIKARRREVVRQLKLEWRSK